MTEHKTYCFDVDGVICTNTHGEYEKAMPIGRTIAQINALYDVGHKIVLFTARGTVTSRDCREITEQQMNAWGVRYHELLFGKPYFDLMIDDRAMSLEEWERHAPTVLPK